MWRQLAVAFVRNQEFSSSTEFPYVGMSMALIGREPPFEYLNFMQYIEECPLAETATPSLQACVLYADEDCASAAKLLCSRYEFESGLGPVATRFHRFDSLQDDGARATALQDALSSQLLIVAAPDGAPLPRIMKFWIGEFLGMKSHGCTTIVAVTKAQVATEKQASPVRAYLEEIASLLGMPFALFRFSNEAPTGRASYGPVEGLQAA